MDFCGCLRIVRRRFESLVLCTWFFVLWFFVLGTWFLVLTKNQDQSPKSPNDALCNLCVLCVSVVDEFRAKTHHREHRGAQRNLKSRTLRQSAKVQKPFIRSRAPHNASFVNPARPGTEERWQRQRVLRESPGSGQFNFCSAVSPIALPWAFDQTEE